jgi:arabinofuranan 3-O-arabinosyltransferase
MNGSGQGGDPRAASGCQDNPRLLPIFVPWRLQAYAAIIASLYLSACIQYYRIGVWIVSSSGAPIYADFSTCWVAGVQALHGNISALYDATAFLKIQSALLGPQEFLYPNWPYPPPFSLIMLPFALLPYFWAFVAWTSITLLGLLTTIYLIIRRSAAITLVIALPYTAWNILAGQNGFLTASLLGASLAFLERQPVLAGVFLGLLTYKPQFGILLPVAVIASKNWHAFASAIVTIALLVAVSIAAFGIAAWEAFPRGLSQQYGVVLIADGVPDSEANWGYLQTVYGLLRFLHSGAHLAWVGQAIVTLSVATIVWLVWRSTTRFSLKAAILSTAALLASPYAFAYDLVATVIPVAFIAKDQMRYGVLKGEQTALLMLFGAIFGLLLAFRDSPDGTPFGRIPAVGPTVLLVIIGIALRRVIAFRRPWIGFRSNPREDFTGDSRPQRSTSSCSARVLV